MMKNFYFAIMTLLCFSAFAQKAEKSPKNYNRFSIDVNAGINKPGELFSPGYFTSDPDTYMNFNRFSHYSMGFRYMVNTKFGIRLDGAYDLIVPEKDNGSLDFKSEQYRIGLQGYVNVRNLLNFDSWTKRFGFLFHGGIQVSRLNPIYRVTELGEKIDLDYDEDNGGFIFGFTPQYRITNRLVFTLDVSFLMNTRAHLTWDGELAETSNNLKSNMVNTTFGLTYYFGKHDIHADFAPDEDNSKLDDINNKLADLEKELENKQDKQEDKDGNGIPDNIDNYIKEQLANYKSDNTNNVETTDLVRKMINDGYICAYFDFDKRFPTLFSSDNIDFIRTYLLKNPESNVKVTGFADVLGSEEYNNKLGLDRANSVKDVLIKSGIDANRISTISAGEDDTVDKDSEFARRMVRRALFYVD